MPDRTGPSRRGRVTDVDSGEIRKLAIAARDGDPNATPPVEATHEAPEIGRRIALALSLAMDNGKGTDADRATARANLIGLAGHGGAAYGKLVLREGKIKISRRGDVFTVNSGYAIPSVIAANGSSELEATADAELLTGQGSAAHVLPSAVYVQFDLMTWAQFHALYASLNRRFVGLGAVLTAFDEIAKLEPLYPRMTVGEALDAAGLDRDTLIPTVDLDDVLGDDAGEALP